MTGVQGATSAMMQKETARKQTIPALTGIRGVAACWVVIYHVHEFDHLPVSLATVIRHGYLAVDLFFILSGFIMALTYSGRFSSGDQRRNYADFLLHRAARIYPLYLCMTLLIVLLEISHTGVHTYWRSLAFKLGLNLLLIQSWGFGAPIDGPGWSISTEFGAYLLFPFLMVATVYRKAWQASLVGILCVLAVGAISLIPTPASYQFPRMGPLDISWEHSLWPLIRCVLEFSVGLVAFRLLQIEAVARSFAKPIAAIVSSSVVIAATFIPNGDMLFFVASGALLLALAKGSSGVVRFFGSNLAVFFGNISYAMYLLHWVLMPVRSSVGKMIGDTGALIIFYASLIAVAWLLYAIIEKPGRRFINSLHERVGFRHGPAPAASR